MSHHAHTPLFQSKINPLVDSVVQRAKEDEKVIDTLDKLTQPDEIAGKAVFHTGVSAFSDLAGIPVSKPALPQGQGVPDNKFVKAEETAKGKHPSPLTSTHPAHPPAPVPLSSVSAFADRVAFLPKDEQDEVVKAQRKWAGMEGK
ncbi:hypothetical protein HDU93_006122 [Gonapodya sp. JEL0774]|nr:hypothetical protein HDU93_006122 [Gonapodya sp. JEL0774]